MNTSTIPRSSSDVMSTSTRARSSSDVMNTSTRARSNSIFIKNKEGYLGNGVPATIRFRVPSAPIEGASSRSLAIIFATPATDSRSESEKDSQRSSIGPTSCVSSSIDWSCNDTHAYTRAILNDLTSEPSDSARLKHMTRIVSLDLDRVNSEGLYEMARLCQQISYTSSDPKKKAKCKRLMESLHLSVAEFAISFNIIGMLKMMTPLEQEVMQLQIKTYMKRLLLDPSRISLEGRYKIHEEVKDLIKYVPSVKLKEKYTKILDLLDLCMPTSQERLKELIKEIDRSSSSLILYKFHRILLSYENKFNNNIERYGSSIVNAIYRLIKKDISFNGNKCAVNIFILLIKYDSIIKNYNMLRLMFYSASYLNEKNELSLDVINMIVEITDETEIPAVKGMEAVYLEMLILLELINNRTEKGIEVINMFLKILEKKENNKKLMHGLKMLLVIVIEDPQTSTLALEKKFKDILKSVHQLVVSSNKFNNGEIVILLKVVHELINCKSVVMDSDTFSFIYNIVCNLNANNKFKFASINISIEILNKTLKSIKYFYHKNDLDIKRSIKLLLQEIESQSRGNSRLSILEKMKLHRRKMNIRPSRRSSSEGQLPPVVSLSYGKDGIGRGGMPRAFANKQPRRRAAGYYKSSNSCSDAASGGEFNPNTHRHDSSSRESSSLSRGQYFSNETQEISKAVASGIRNTHRHGSSPRRSSIPFTRV